MLGHRVLVLLGCLMVAAARGMPQQTSDASSSSTTSTTASPPIAVTVATDAEVGDIQDKVDICSLPAETFDPPQCRSAIPKWTFSSAEEKCVPHLYTGCGGSRNLFDTQEQCVQRCEIRVSADDVPTSETCDSLHHKHYLEFGCTPVHESGSSCPTSYDCSHLQNRDKEKCYYKGKEYNQRDQIAEPTEVNPCQVHCMCSPPFSDFPAKITCANVECPELFRGPPTPPAGGTCKRIVTPGKCCATYNCLTKEELEAMNADNATKPATCEYDNKVYMEGEAFYPEDKPCHVCHCQKGFTGAITQPFCKEIDCGMEIHYSVRMAQGCSPVYLEKGCCPIDWICPHEQDRVKKALVAETPKALSQKCMHGNLTLEVGEQLINDDPCVACTCKTPPQLTCIRTTCPPRPELQGTCSVIQDANQCCPSYSCKPTPAFHDDPCETTTCTSEEKCILDAGSGPRCVKKTCPDDGINCGANCTADLNEEGCLSCNCGKSNE